MKLKAFNYKGNTFSYAEYGNLAGFPILIQHGLIASIRDCELFQSLINAGRRVLCIARPGYGESSTYQLKNISEWGIIVSHLVKYLHITQFDQIGTSSGAPYAYAIAHINHVKVRNTYIFSGTPALYSSEIAVHWPYPIDKKANIPDLQILAKNIFFSNISGSDNEKYDIVDSMNNNCFGIALDLQIRCRDWGFELSKIDSTVYMQHAKNDSQVPFITAELTAKLLPKCMFELIENGGHFSKELFDAFLQKIVLEKST